MAGVAEPMNEPKRKALDVAFEGDKKETKKARGSTKLSLKSQVNAAIRDNCKGFTHTQIDVMEVEGQTLRARVTRDKEQTALGLVDIKFGWPYWAKIRELYTQESDTVSKLRLKPEQRPTAELRDALKLFYGHPCNRSLVRTHFDGLSGKMDEVTLKVALGCLQRMRAMSSLEQLHTGLAIMRAIVRCQAVANEADIVKLCTPKYDEYLLQVFMTQANTGVKPVEFIESLGELAFLVLPELETKEVMNLEADQPLSVVGDALKVLVSSSALGERLFASATRNIIMADVRSCVECHMCTLSNMRSLSESIVLGEIQVIKNEVRAMQGLALIDSRRDIDVMYRTMSLKLPIKSVEDEVDTRVQVWIRGAAAAQGLLPSLTAESDVFAAGEGKIKAELEASLVSVAKQSRRTFSRLLLEVNEFNGDAVLAKLDEFSTRMAKTDRLWGSEAAVITSICGEKGGLKLKELAELRCLPSAANVMTLKEAHEAINKLCESQLFKVSSMSAQAELKTVRLWFDKLVADSPPQMTSSMTSWLTRFFAFLAKFVTWTISVKTEQIDEDAKEEGHQTISEKTLYGADALKAQLLHVLSKPDASKADMAPFGVWNHLLSIEDQSLAAEKAKALDVKTCKPEPAVPKPKPAPKKNKDARADLDSTLDAILYG